MSQQSHDASAALQFLQQVLPVIRENNGDAEVVYPLFDANIHLLNDDFSDILRNWVTDEFEQAQSEEAQSIASDIIYFGNRICQFPRGSKASNVEIAIACYETVLKLYTREALPYKWAMTQMNLGNAYSDRIKGDKAENIELAIIGFQQALEVTTRQAFPYYWAMTQMNLGIAYGDRIKGDKAENIELAIIAYQQALEVTTRQAFPYYWAMTQMNLGIAYGDRIKGDKAENIEQAIIAYQQALEVYTREAFPYYWAMTQMNLGAAYCERINGDKADNIELAIIAYQQALEVYTREAFPQDYAETLSNLGTVYQDDGRFNHAYDTYESAITTVELLRGEIISGEESKRKQAEEWNELYRRMVEVCLRLGKDCEAVEYIERSKTRNLVELLLNDEVSVKGEKSPEDNQKLQRLRDEIAVEKQRLQQAEINNRNSQQEPETLDVIPRLSQGTRVDAIGSKLNQLRQQREDLISKIIGYKAIRFPEIQQLIDENTAIIQWYIYYDCFRAFVITRDRNKPQIWCSSPEDLEKLEDYWNSEYLQSYRQDKKRWKFKLNDKLQQLPEILHLDEVISLVPPNTQKLILVPHLYLHLLPIHGLKLSDGEYLIDKFSHGVNYAPSCQLHKILQQTQKRNHRRESLFAIQNPTNDLEYSDIEVETIATKFQPNYILKHYEATGEAFQQQSNSDNFKNANWLHFSCHGYFNLNNPYKSALQLHDAAKVATTNATESSRTLRISEEEAIELEKCLTLENILELKLSNCRLVTLCACESGFTDFSNTSDEYIGLPSGFIHAGAASTVSSLWAADDFSTAILTIKFYENIQNSTFTNNIALALNQAQKWLREITIEQLRQWIDENQNITAENNSKLKNRLAEYNPQEKPFEKPYYWAGFYAVGD